MGKCYCDYCDVFLTHDSVAVRKQHNDGNRHRQNVCEYYRQFVGKEGQDKVNAVVAEFEMLVAKGMVRPSFGISVINGIINGVTTTGAAIGYGKDHLPATTNAPAVVAAVISDEKPGSPQQRQAVSATNGTDHSPKRRACSPPNDDVQDDLAKENAEAEISATAVTPSLEIEAEAGRSAEPASAMSGAVATADEIAEATKRPRGTDSGTEGPTSEPDEEAGAVAASTPQRNEQVDGAIPVVEGNASKLVEDDAGGNGSDMDMEMDDQ
jgi:U1 zinc finger